MKKLLIPFIVLGGVILVGLFWVAGQNQPTITTTTSTTILTAAITEKPAVVEKTVRVAGLKIITLFQSGDGESDLALFVSGELAKKYAGRVKFQSVDVEAQPEMAEFYHVVTYPTLLFLSPTGKLLKKHEGYLAKEEIEATINSLSKI